MEIGTIYPTKQGDLIITKYVNYHNVHVRFINTGYERIARKDHIKEGTVKDPYARTVFKKGYVGEGKYTFCKHREAYNKWSSMLGRVFGKYVKENYPTYSECTICDSWLCFQNFAEWFYSQDYEGKELDKDIKVKGNKHYSPETCLMVTQYENISNTNETHWAFVSPAGVLTKFTKLGAFCREHGLTRENMRAVHKGKRRSHKGWTKYVD